MLRKYNVDEFKKCILLDNSLNNLDIENVVKEICSNVRENGDKAIRNYTKEFDGIVLDSFLVTDKEVDTAYKLVSDKWLIALRNAIKNIKQFHVKQVRSNWFETLPNGVVRGKLVNPIEKIGVYVPGGKASYPSSVLMGVIPAIVAGASEISIVTPPNKEGVVSPETLVAAKELSIEKIYKIGGAQAIAALAYGSESVKKVDKIVGPGNIYVTYAKKEVYGTVGIDMLAGPSEVCVYCDDSANPKYVAADLLSQAEHDPLARILMISKSDEMANLVVKELGEQISELPKREIAKQSINKGAYLIIKDEDIAIDIINDFAPEHLELAVNNPFELLAKIKNAGSIFLGHYAAESLGDYYAGVNHVLPTSGTSKFSSSLGVDDFIKQSEILYYPKEATLADGKDVILLAESEGLSAHANAIRVRIND
jgi:histidinol dehydrogenase